MKTEDINMGVTSAPFSPQEAGDVGITPPAPISMEERLARMEVMLETALKGTQRHIEGLWSLQEAADYLGIEVRTLCRWVKERKIPYIPTGKERGVRFNPKSIKAHIQRKEIPALVLVKERKKKARVAA